MIISALGNLLGYENVQGPAVLLFVIQLCSCEGTLAMVLSLPPYECADSNEELQPSFFRIGYAFPMYYGIRGLRAIYFGSLGDSYHVMVNCLVLFAWFLPSLCATLFMTTRRMKAEKIPSVAMPIWKKVETN